MDLKESTMSVASNIRTIEGLDLTGVTIFTKENCIYCDAAKAVLERAGVVYREIPIGIYPEQWKVICHKHKWNGAPLVLMGDKPVGGFPELCIHFGRKSIFDRSEPSVRI